MCDFGTALASTLQIGGSLFGQHEQAKAYQAQLDAQAKAAVTEMNFVCFSKLRSRAYRCF